MKLVPITLRQAKAFIDEHHRHNKSPQGWKFGVGLEIDGGLVGVAVAGRPPSTVLDDGTTIEVTRVCTLGDRHANSKLYAALLRAAKALGFTRAVTFTLPDEAGSSLRAVGFHLDGETRDHKGWHTGKRAREAPSDRYPTGVKLRWVRDLT